jgi:hypothetical protein
MSNNPAFLGRGLSFPVRINSRAGGFIVTEGIYNSASIAVQYVADRFTIREPIGKITNHVAEAIYSIIMTSELSWEHLPPYGSRVMNVLFDPSTAEFRLLFESYLRFSTWRWEKRARYPEKGGISWTIDGLKTDRGELPIYAQVEFLSEQRPDNLVLPFVTVRDARVAEYPSSVIDGNGHDMSSRYYKRQAHYYNDYKYIRVAKNMDITPANDDIFYQVMPLDTPMLASWFCYGTPLYWHYLWSAYLYDMSKLGATRDIINPDNDDQSVRITKDLDVMAIRIRQFSNDLFLTEAEAISLSTFYSKLSIEATRLSSIATVLGITTNNEAYCNALTYLHNGLEKWLDQDTYPISVTREQRVGLTDLLNNLSIARSNLIEEITIKRLELIQEHPETNLYFQPGAIIRGPSRERVLTITARR